MKKITRRNNKDAYDQVLGVFQKQKQGVTVADLTARTALPLEQVRELAAAAADEYRARLEVTESGEILYSFPYGFVSKYRGFRQSARRAWKRIKQGLVIAGTALFKVWIMVMLIGYFALFMLIALAALVVSVAAAGSSNSDNRSSRRGGGMGGFFLASQLVDLIIRIWFYSELAKSLDPSEPKRAKPKGRPLHRAIFSFVFGDKEADWASREKQSLIAYIQAHRGVISLPEFMALTGLPPAEADGALLGFCAEFGGMPEASEAGTVVYRFDPLLLRGDRRDRSFPGFSAVIRQLRSFSSNPRKLNRWFSGINAVNLVFGGYFLFHALTMGGQISNATVNGVNYLYALTYLLLRGFTADPLPLLTLGLGLIPLLFSFLFWLIPGLRALALKRENERIKWGNLRKLGYGRIWEAPLRVSPNTLGSELPECRLRDMAGAKDRIIKELGAYAVPEVSLDDRGEPVYAFTELAREKAALDQYRGSLDRRASSLGKTVFDSEA